LNCGAHHAWSFGSFQITTSLICGFTVIRSATQLQYCRRASSVRGVSSGRPKRVTTMRSPDTSPTIRYSVSWKSGGTFDSPGCHWRVIRIAFRPRAGVGGHGLRR
jgi:hypothetical protein